MAVLAMSQRTRTFTVKAKVAKETWRAPPRIYMKLTTEARDELQKFLRSLALHSHVVVTLTGKVGKGRKR